MQPSGSSAFGNPGPSSGAFGSQSSGNAFGATGFGSSSNPTPFASSSNAFGGSTNPTTTGNAAPAQTSHGTAVFDPQALVRTMPLDMRDYLHGSMWPLTSYAVFKFESSILEGLDTSPEEVRLQYYQLRNTPGGLQQFESMWNSAYSNARSQYSDDPHRLAQMLTEADRRHKARLAQSQPGPTSAFGPGGMGAPQSAFGPGGSGMPQQQSAFSQPQQNAFGQPVVQSAFGPGGQGAPQLNAFGQPQPSTFSQPQQNAFGQPQQNAFTQPQQSAFGPGGIGPAQSTFGQPQPTTNAFGQPQPVINAFGQPQPTNAFGQPQPVQNAFTQAQPAQNAFGQPQPTPNVFGQPQVPQNTFGQPQPAQSAFGSGGSGQPQQTGFGAAPTAPTSFGQPQQQQQSNEPKMSIKFRQRPLVPNFIVPFPEKEAWTPGPVPSFDSHAGSLLPAEVRAKYKRPTWPETDAARKNVVDASAAVPEELRKECEDVWKADKFDYGKIPGIPPPSAYR
ncbi:hypothetical protein DACRYDRAFT_113266 [Dacryopinax primogenitus]|uniref:Uncharacterized protein n=1 Tax=Dacryopinax primogenitus (strain DJM 731) TaxID=1858805 RepID=M5GFU8_DACPD|nr:uncharacterized protein DACRYDRAFT_113266 [Dacryopinax primogenitus]EJU06602.1 hypothetical protein DACRYDRAFT_113266 [Dacryopinax primogenitus]